MTCVGTCVSVCTSECVCTRVRVKPAKSLSDINEPLEKEVVQVSSGKPDSTQRNMVYGRSSLDVEIKWKCLLESPE